MLNGNNLKLNRIFKKKSTSLPLLNLQVSITKLNNYTVQLCDEDICTGPSVWFHDDTVFLY